MVTMFPGARAPWGGQRTAVLLAVLLAVGGAVAALAVVEGQCEAGQSEGDCAGLQAQLTQTEPAAEGGLEELAPVPEVLAPARNTTGRAGRKHEFGALRIGFVLSLLGFVTLWIAGTIKFAVDGSLPARLAIWGLLPEAYAAISVRAVVALLRLKTGTTPVVVLRNCVTDDGALELAEAMRRYGKQSDLQALELPHNPGMGRAAIGHLAAAALEEGSTLQELDISYNPQLGDAAVSLLLPLLKPKASQVNALRLADCNLSANFVQTLADKAAVSSLRILDLSCNALAGAGEALAALCEAPVLEELTLAGCGLRSEDVRELADQLPYTSLRSLHLGGNGLGGQCLATLSEKLPQSQVDELGLEGNNLELADMSALGQAWAARPFSRIRLNGNRMTQAEVAQFIRTLRSIHV